MASIVGGSAFQESLLNCTLASYKWFFIIDILFVLRGISYSLLWIKLAYLQILFRLSLSECHRTARPHHASTTLFRHLPQRRRSLFFRLGGASLAIVQWWWSTVLLALRLFLLAWRSTATISTAATGSNERRFVIFHRHLWLKMAIFRLSYFSWSLRTDIFLGSRAHFGVVGGVYDF